MILRYDRVRGDFMKHLPIGEQIRYYRKKRNLNQKQLATLAS